MKVEHLAIWVKDLEVMKEFYLRYFDFTTNEKYVNPKKNFSSYFLSLGSGARIELMHRPDIEELLERSTPKIGLAHFAISIGSKENVDLLTDTLRYDGHPILSEPRTTGDGYYESVFADPEGNLVELTE